MNLDCALEVVDPKWRAEFRRFVTTGKATEEFLNRFDENLPWQEAAAAVLVSFFSPFAEAIQNESEEGKPVPAQTARASGVEASLRTQEVPQPQRGRRPAREGVDR